MPRTSLTRRLRRDAAARRELAASRHALRRMHREPPWTWTAELVAWLCATLSYCGTGLKCLVHAPQRSLEWFIARYGRIGASTGGVPLGISAYNAPADLWEKLFTPGIDPTIWAFPSNEATAHGTKYEPLACALYETLSGNRVWETGMWSNRLCSWVHASPDGLVEQRPHARRHDADTLQTSADIDVTAPPFGLLEIKCPLYKMYPYIPAGYLAQMQQQMWTLDCEWCDFFVYYRDGGECALWRVHRSRAWQHWALRKLELFRTSRSKEECTARLPWLCHEMQSLIATDWDFERVAREHRRSVEFLKAHLPCERVRIERRWAAATAA